MSIKNRLPFRFLLVFTVLLGAMLACGWYDRNDNPIIVLPSGPHDKLIIHIPGFPYSKNEYNQNDSNQNSPGQKSAKPSATSSFTPPPAKVGTVFATLPPEVWFASSDCPKDLFPGLTASGDDLGVLVCTYHWPGKFGINNAEIRIFQYTDRTRYNQTLQDNLDNDRKAVTNEQATQDAPNLAIKKAIDVIEDDITGYIYMETYEGNYQVNNETPTCGFGWGNVGVDEKFVVTVDITDACDISLFAPDYSRTMISMRDAALAAIAHAEAGSKP